MDAVLIVLLLAPPLAAAVVALAARRAARAAAWANAVTMPLSAAAAAVMALGAAGGGAPLVAGSLWRVDALSALLALLVSTVATLASWLGPGLERGNSVSTAEVRRYRVYANLFAAMMLIAVTTSNLGVMWVAIEATTVTSALLVPWRRTRAALDASWKYLFIGSVGIALAFAGTVLAFVDYATTGGNLEMALQWTTLRASAPSLHPEVARMAFVFLLVGFGTKAGLAPTHTWLPDAHSEAPAPLSAMMSGVLLAVALYAVARWKAIVDLAIGSGFSDTMLLIVGVLTLAVGSISLLAQTQYKRLLAYSSIEHMGLACIGFALGPAGVFAGLLHLSGHALAKSTAFLLSGRVYDRCRSGEISGAAGLLATAPPTAVLLAAAVFALAGLPPFGLFLSEILIVQAAWRADHVLLTAVVLVLILVAFASLVSHLQRVLFGEGAAGVPRGERVTPPLALLAVPLVVLAWVGVMPPEALQMLLTHAAEVLRP
jgi:hydrogenase-4 component F